MSLKKLRNLTKRVPIRWRLTLLFVAIFGASLITFGTATFEFLSQSLQREFDDALYNYAVDVSESISLDPSGDLSLSPPTLDRHKIYPFSLGTALILIRHRGGQVLEKVGEFGNFEIPFKREVQRLSLGEDPVYRTITKLEGLPSKEAESYRIISISLDTATPPQLIMQIAVPMTILENQIHNRKIVFEFGIPLILVIASAAAYFLSARALKPIRDIIQKSNAIGVTNLSQRLPIPSAQDEVRELAVTLNQMIERLEKAFQSQERFVADASHQLLTPLSILKGELEQSQRSGQWQVTHIQSLLQEVDHLTKLVQDLLLLARVDAGLGTMVLQPLYFDEVVLEAIGKAQKIARPRGIQLSYNILETNNERPQVQGDEDLLSHLVLNLLENAVKYSPEGSNIQVRLDQTGTLQRLSVEDQGPGIAPDEIEAIFERFRRGRPKNQQTRAGYGLGLAIASQIAQVHGGRLWAENRGESSISSTGAAFHFEIKNF
jgi:hypothetical protein